MSCFIFRHTVDPNRLFPGTTNKARRQPCPFKIPPVSISSAARRPLVHSSRRIVFCTARTAPVGITPIRPVRDHYAIPPNTRAVSNLPSVLLSNQSSQLYGDQASGIFGLASGRATNNLNVSVVGGVFSRQPTRQSVTFGLALQPPSSGSSNNAGTLHWLGYDPGAYSGDITWRVTTVSSNTDAATFEIDGWEFKTGSTTVTNSNQDLPSVIDPLFPNMFFPSQEAQLIRE